MTRLYAKGTGTESIRRGEDQWLVLSVGLRQIYFAKVTNSTWS